MKYKNLKVLYRKCTTLHYIPCLSVSVDEPLCVGTDIRFVIHRSSMYDLVASSGVAVDCNQPNAPRLTPLHLTFSTASVQFVETLAVHRDAPAPSVDIKSTF